MKPRFSRRAVYALAGLLLSVGAPAGLLVVRLAVGDASSRALGEEWSREWLTYVYIAVSTALVFALFGGVLGGKADRLARLATADTLTSLLNRRGLAGRLDEELHRARRYRQPLSVLLIDVDHLKEINDHHGHDAGDGALRNIGDAIASGCRATDVAGRWGGDEFVVLAPSTPPHDARLLGERIRRSVAELSGAARLSVSVGFVSTDGSSDSSPEALLGRADVALYAAKERGRNQVVGETGAGPWR